MPSTWPSVTFWPGLTSTAVTWPPVMKFTFSDCDASTLPVADTDESTTPRCATAVRVTDAEDELVAEPTVSAAATPSATRIATSTRFVLLLGIRFIAGSLRASPASLSELHERCLRFD